MKFVLFLIKYICLLLLILLLAEVVKCGCQSGCLDIVRHLYEGGLAASVTTPWFALMAGLLLLMGLLRGVTAIWNIIFCWSIVLLIFLIILVSFGTDVALPGAAAVLSSEPNLIMAGLDQLSLLIGAHIVSTPNCEFLLLLVPMGLILGGLFSNSRLRIAFYSVVGYALWYGLSELLLYLLTLWGQSEAPLLAEVQVFLSDSDWVIPTLMGVFFTIYVTILAFYETYSPRRSEDEASGKEARNEVLTEREMPESLTEAELNPAAVNMVPDADPTVPLHPGTPPAPQTILTPPAIPLPQAVGINTAAARPSAELPPTAAAKVAAEPRGEATHAARAIPQPIPPTQASHVDAAELSAAAAAVSRESSGQPLPATKKNDEEEKSSDQMIDAALSSLPAEDSKAAEDADQAPTVPLPPTETFDEIREALSDMREAREEAVALAEQRRDDSPEGETSASDKETAPSAPAAAEDAAAAASAEAPSASDQRDAEQSVSKPEAPTPPPTAPSVHPTPAPLPVPPLPVAPVAPVAPAAPVPPEAPVAPVAPVAPEAPVPPEAPAAPVAPVAPVPSEAPAAPEAPQQRKADQDR